MDIYERLKQDHNRQRDLCAKIKETNGDSPERRALWDKLKLELEAHAAAEEQVFYAALMKRPDATEDARHSVAEHQDMTQMIEALDAMDMSNSGWLNKFNALAHDVIHHVDEEEADVFPVSKDNIADKRADVMGDEFETRKQAELTLQAAE